MLENAGIETRSYSGRGMYGKECLGVSIDRGGLGNFIADVLENLDTDRVEEIAEAFRHLSTDSLGLGMIAYFPGVPYNGSSSDDEDEDSDEG